MNRIAVPFDPSSTSSTTPAISPGPISAVASSRTARPTISVVESPHSAASCTTCKVAGGSAATRARSSVGQRRRHRRIVKSSAVGEQFSDLDGVQRVPVDSTGQLDGVGTGQRKSHAFEHDVRDRIGREPAEFDGQRLRSAGVRGGDERCRLGRSVPGHDQKRLVSHRSGDERQCGGARVVEPLRIVDDDDQGSPSGDVAREVGECQRDPVGHHGVGRVGQRHGVQVGGRSSEGVHVVGIGHGRGSPPAPSTPALVLVESEPGPTPCRRVRRRRHGTPRASWTCRCRPRRSRRQSQPRPARPRRMRRPADRVRVRVRLRRTSRAIVGSIRRRSEAPRSGRRHRAGVHGPLGWPDRPALVWLPRPAVPDANEKEARWRRW